MLEIMYAKDMASFFGRVKDIRAEKQDWNIMEVAIEDEWQDKLTVEEIAARLKEAFSDKEGVGLICNPREVLCLIKWGQDRGITELCARAQNNLPDQACAVEGSDMTAEGIERVQVKLAGTVQDRKTIHQLRAKHTKEIILIASEDKDFKDSALPVFQEYGQVFFAADYEKMMQLYKEKAPEMLIWDTDTIRKGDDVPLRSVTDMDDEASIVCVGAAMNASMIVEAKKLGIDKIVQKPIDEKLASQLIGSCPHFGWKT